MKTLFRSALVAAIALLALPGAASACSNPYFCDEVRYYDATTRTYTSGYSGYRYYEPVPVYDYYGGYYSNPKPVYKKVKKPAYYDPYYSFYPSYYPSYYPYSGYYYW